MYKLNLPTYELSFENRGGKNLVFDISRKKYVALTPEEFVRQQFLHFLIEEKKYPKSLLAIEVSLKINNLNKRADMVLFDTAGKARVIIECKAPEVSITQKTFDQIVRYNMNYSADYLIVTNGLSHYCAQILYETNSYRFLKDIPDFAQIT